MALASLCPGLELEALLSMSPGNGEEALCLVPDCTEDGQLHPLLLALVLLALISLGGGPR